MKAKITIICTAILALAVLITAQGTGTPSTLRVLTDATNALLVSSVAQTLPISQPIPFNQARLRTDSNGNLVVVDAGSGGDLTVDDLTILGTFSQGPSLTPRAAHNDLTNDLVLANNTYLSWKDTGSGDADIMIFDTANNLHIRTPSGQQILFDISNASLIDYADSLTGAGNIFSYPLRNVNSATGPTITVSGAIPAGCNLRGLSSKVYTSFGTTNGLTSFDMGVGADTDAFGATLGITDTDSTDNTDWTDGTWSRVFPAATDIILTGNGDGGDEFDGTGNIRISVQCDTSRSPQF